MKILRFVDKALARLEGWLIIVFLFFMVTGTFFQVILRALYTHARIQWANTVLGQVDWSEPFVRLLVLWVTFLGASLITRENKHIKIDLMSAILPRQLLPLRELILSLSCVVIMALMLEASLGYVKMEMAFEGYMFLNLPSWIGQLILPAGFFLILFRFFIRGVEQGIEIFRGGGK